MISIKISIIVALTLTNISHIATYTSDMLTVETYKDSWWKRLIMSLISLVKFSIPVTKLL